MGRLITAFIILSHTTVYASEVSSESAKGWPEQRSALVSALRDALRRTEAPDQGGRENIRPVLEAAWALNVEVIKTLGKTQRAVAYGRVVREAVLETLAGEPLTSDARGRAITMLFITIADESHFAPGRLITEIAEPKIAKAGAAAGAALVAALIVLGIGEGVLYFEHWYWAMLGSAPFGIMIMGAIAESEPGREELTPDYVPRSWRDCESLVLRHTLRRELNPPVIEQSETD